MFLVLSWQWDKEEILCPHEESNLRTLDFSAPYIFTEYKTYHLSYFNNKQYSIDIADPSNMLDACYIWTL